MNRRAPEPSSRAGSIFRIHMGASAILSWYAAIADAGSLLNLAAKTLEGMTLMWLLMLVGVAAVVDAFVNDVLPARFHWRVALRQRHFIFAALAFCYIAQLYVAFFNLRSSALLMYYLLNAGTIMVMAFFDAHQRSKDAACVIVCN